jgi:oligo-1,6-glucosidase
MGPHLHDYLKEMNSDISKYDVMSVAEGAGNTFEDAHNWSMRKKRTKYAYAFEGVDVGNPRGYSLLLFKKYSAVGIVPLLKRLASFF